ncbi:MAG TPA: hypothetical protein DEQ58_07660 [Alcanivorax sp.]|nr:hypothetical protein [Alcanivorax sp.]
MHHARNGAPVPPLTLNAGERTLELVFPGGWLAEHPLTLADLEQEQEFFQAAGYQLTVTDAA